MQLLLLFLDDLIQTIDHVVPAIVLLSELVSELCLFGGVGVDQG